MKKHQSSLNAALELCLNEQVASGDMDAVAHERGRVAIIIAFTMLCIVVALILVYSDSAQAYLTFVNSIGINAVTGVVAMVFLIYQVIRSIKYSDRT